MSGDSTPRKRGNKRRKKDVGNAPAEQATAKMKSSIDEDDCSPPLAPGDERMHVQKESSTGGGVISKVIFFILFLGLLGTAAIVILEYRGTSDVDIPTEESRFGSIFAGWVDETPETHDVSEEDHDVDHEDEHEHSEEEEEGEGSDEDSGIEEEDLEELLSQGIPGIVESGEDDGSEEGEKGSEEEDEGIQEEDGEDEGDDDGNEEDEVSTEEGDGEEEEEGEGGDEEDDASQEQKQNQVSPTLPIAASTKLANDTDSSGVVEAKDEKKSEENLPQIALPAQDKVTVHTLNEDSLQEEELRKLGSKSPKIESGSIISDKGTTPSMKDVKFSAQEKHPDSESQKKISDHENVMENVIPLGNVEEKNEAMDTVSLVDDTLDNILIEPLVSATQEPKTISDATVEIQKSSTDLPINQKVHDSDESKKINPAELVDDHTTKKADDGKDQNVAQNIKHVDHTDDMNRKSEEMITNSIDNNVFKVEKENVKIHETVQKSTHASKASTTNNKERQESKEKESKDEMAKGSHLQTDSVPIKAPSPISSNPQENKIASKATDSNRNEIKIEEIESVGEKFDKLPKDTQNQRTLGDSQFVEEDLKSSKGKETVKTRNSEINVEASIPDDAPSLSPEGKVKGLQQEPQVDSRHSKVNSEDVGKNTANQYEKNTAKSSNTEQTIDKESPNHPSSIVDGKLPLKKEEEEGEEDEGIESGEDSEEGEGESEEEGQEEGEEEEGDADESTDDEEESSGGPKKMEESQVADEEDDEEEEEEEEEEDEESPPPPPARRGRNTGEQSESAESLPVYEKENITNDDDFVIRQQLDEADVEIERGYGV